MSTLRLKKAFSPLFLVSILMAFAATSAASKPAQAFDDFYGQATCGMQCLGYGNTMFNPFMGMPQFPMSYGFANYGQTGQMPDYRYQMSQAIAWNGSQQLGTTYMPAVGITAIQNSQAAAAIGI